MTRNPKNFFEIQKKEIIKYSIYENTFMKSLSFMSFHSNTQTKEVKEL